MNATLSQPERPIEFPEHTVCAWCQKESGRAHNPDDSHTICQRHKAEELAKVKHFPKSEFA